MRPVDTGDTDVVPSLTERVNNRKDITGASNTPNVHLWILSSAFITDSIVDNVNIVTKQITFK